MELVKKNIHMDQIKGQAATQITLEDDVNISDSKPDAGKLIYEGNGRPCDSKGEDAISCNVSDGRGTSCPGLFGGQPAF